MKKDMNNMILKLICGVGFALFSIVIMFLTIPSIADTSDKIIKTDICVKNSFEKYDQLDELYKCSIEGYCLFKEYPEKEIGLYVTRFVNVSCEDPFDPVITKEGVRV